MLTFQKSSLFRKFSRSTAKGSTSTGLSLEIQISSLLKKVRQYPHYLKKIHKEKFWWFHKMSLKLFGTSATKSDFTLSLNFSKLLLQLSNSKGGELCLLK